MGYKLNCQIKKAHLVKVGFMSKLGIKQVISNYINFSISLAIFFNNHSKIIFVLPLLF